MTKETNELFGVPDGYDYQLHHTQESWQKVTVTWAFAKCKKTEKQIVRRLLPEVTSWRIVSNKDIEFEKLEEVK